MREATINLNRAKEVLREAQKEFDEAHRSLSRWESGWPFMAERK